MIVIIIFLCYHNYHNYYFVYRHYANCYFCFHHYHFVECPNITFTNSWYIISVCGLFWYWNRENCQSHGGDLVSIETEGEWNFINDEIQRRNTTHYKNRWSIGLSKKAGNWTWVSGRLLTVSKWGQGEPSGEQDAAFMYKRTSSGEQGVFGGVNSENWGYQDAYICEISKGELIFCCSCCFYCYFQ